MYVTKTDFTSSLAAIADLITRAKGLDLSYDHQVAHKAVTDALRATDVPTITGAIATHKAVTDAIRATDVPAIQAAIAALTFNPRGQLKILNVTTSSLSYVTALTVTGHGILYYIYCTTAGASTAKLKLTIDGLLNVVDQTADGPYMFAKPRDTYDTQYMEVLAQPDDLPFPLEFQNSLLIEHKKVGGDSNVKICYAQD